MGVVLNFHLHGTCAEALELYAAAFCTKPDVLLRNSDANPADWKDAEDRKDRVYHAEMTVSGLRCFFSDEPDDCPPAPGALSALVTFDDADAVVRAYHALKGGAAIVHPMRMTTYSACFVSLVDRFGVRWELMTETPPSYTVRTADVRDARAVAEVLTRSWGEAYRGMLSEELLARQTDVEIRRAKVESHIGDAGNMTLLMEKGEVACGMAGLVPCAGRDGAIELEAFYIVKAEWGRGAGRYLMDHALEAARAAGYLTMTLTALWDNARARAFYEKCGFVETGAETIALKAADGVSDATVVRYERNLA